MQLIRGIRIENIFWMLAYAWDEFEAARTVSVSLDQTGAPLTPFASCFLTGVERLIRQGFYQDFVSDRKRLSALRGCILPLPTLRENGVRLGRVWCEYNRVSINVLPNQIIRTALRQIDQAVELDHGIRKRARSLDRRFEGVQVLDVLPRDFEIVGAGAQKRGYRFLLLLAKFILTGLRPVGFDGRGQFFDVDVQRIIHDIFERFVRNFLCRHLPSFHVRRTRRSWADAHPQNKTAESLLPLFETDVVLTRLGRTIVIDTKFYTKTLREHRGVEKAREAHLYQLLGYLHNMLRSGRFGKRIEGVLLYPLAQTFIDARWIIHDFPVCLRTLDLSRPWHDVSAELLAIARAGGTVGSESLVAPETKLSTAN